MSIEGKRPEVKYIITTINFMALAILFLPSIHSYYLSRNPYKSDVVQIEPPLAVPYIERRSEIRDQEKNTPGYWRQDSDIPAVLQSSLLHVGHDDLTDYTNDYGNILGNMPANGETYDDPIVDIYAVSSEPLVDLPTGIPESEKEVPGEPLTPKDFENAENLEILVPPQDEDSPDPILSAGLFEGDIAGINMSDFSSFEKNAIRDLRKRWPGGIIPYVISSSFSLYERSVIAAAVLDFHAYTCVRFVPRTTQWDYIHLLKGSGCSSLVGHSGGGQQVSLGPGCLYKGIVEHELMHACGFWHEQSRGDRDNYVTILWKNIMPGTEHNFQKFGWRVMQNLGVAYDTGSLMHYGRYAFSKDYRSPTIIPRNPAANIGQRRGFSETDLLKINKLYECQKGIVVPSGPITSKPYVCSNNNKLCQYWAKAGECTKNPAWMNVNCAKSCKLCKDSNCGNYNRNCEEWARLGECTKNPDYMTIYCPQACHSCRLGTDEGAACKDRNRYCTAWAKNGQCRANPDYMLSYCRKACNQC